MRVRALRFGGCGQRQGGTVGVCSVRARACGSCVDTPELGAALLLDDAVCRMRARALRPAIDVCLARDLPETQCFQTGTRSRLGIETPGTYEVSLYSRSGY